MWYLLAFLLYPVAEIGLFALVVDAIGLLSTLGLLVLGILAGMALIRWQAAQSGRTLQEALSGSGDPTVPLAKGAAVVLAGILLIVPGFLSDIIALLLLFPPFRNWLFGRFGAGIRVMSAAQPFRSQTHGDVIDGDYVEVSPQEPETGKIPRISGGTQH